MSTTSQSPVEVLAETDLGTDPMVMLAARGLARRYGDGEAAVHALRGLTFELPAGQFTAVMGPSGSGKSTLMHLLAGLDEPTAGTAHLGGHQVTGMSDRDLTRLRRGQIGFVFQSFNLLPTLSVEQNIVLPLEIAGRKIDRDWVASMIATVGLEDRRGHRPAELSGGQQQRVALARALVTEPKVLFADEPTGNLDSEGGQEILGLLRRASDVHGQTTLMVTHDPRAAATADRVLFLADGRLVADREQPTEAQILDVMREVSR